MGMASNDGGFSGTYDSSEMDAELARWDAVKGAWDDAESSRIEEQTYVPLRSACSLLGQEAEELKSKTADLDQRLADIENM